MLDALGSDWFPASDPARPVGCSFSLFGYLHEVADPAPAMQKAFVSLAPKKRRNRAYLASLAETMQWQALGPVCTETKEDGDASGAANQSTSLVGLDAWKREPNKGRMQLNSLASAGLDG